MSNDKDKQKLIIKYKNKQFLFKENIYLFNSYTENEIFAQRRSILLNSFLEFNEKSNMLTEVNSWLYKVTKDDYICKKRDSSKGYKQQDVTPEIINKLYQKTLGLILGKSFP